MSNTHLRYTSRIEGSPETIFDLIADMPNYGRWLPGSQTFGETSDVTPYPVRLGTTYRDHGPAGERHGAVTEFDRPSHIGFHHTQLVTRGPLTAHVDVSIHYVFQPEDRGTLVTRDLDLTVRIRGVLKVADPLIVAAFRRENARLLPILKQYVEALPSESELQTRPATPSPP